MPFGFGSKPAQSKVKVTQLKLPSTARAKSHSSGNDNGTTQSTTTSAPHSSQGAGSRFKTDPAKEERLRAVREQKARLKEAEKARVAALSLGTLYVLLFLRSGQQSDDYHWGFYLHTSPEGGRRYHITNLGSSGSTWIADHGTVNGPFRSNFLVVAIKIGTIPQNRWQEVDTLIRSLDNNLNQPGMDCRVWVQRVMVLLKARGLINYGSISAVVTEFNQIGNQYRESAIQAIQPRPLVNSQQCR